MSVFHQTATILCLALLSLAGCRGELMINDQSQREVNREELARGLADGTIGEEIVLTHGRLHDEDFALLAAYPRITRVEVQNNPTGFGDVALTHLAKLPNLEWINLPSSRATDAGLGELSQLTQLRILNLHSTLITDEGLRQLAPLEKLELLRFGSPHVTDAGIEHLSAIKSLRFLHLIDVPITDAGLKSIAGMTQLESFYLDGGNATDEGLSDLVKARPDLHFHQDQQHLYDDPRRGDHSHGHSHAE